MVTDEDHCCPRLSVYQVGGEATKGTFRQRERKSLNKTV